MDNSSYPFNGMDMLQNSMSQMIGELKNVSKAVAESARSVNNVAMNTATGITGAMGNTHQMAMQATYGMNGVGRQRTSFIKETLSDQYNKPALWSRDLLNVTGLKTEYTDMTAGEANLIAKRNMARRGNNFMADWGITAGSLFLGPAALPATIIGETVISPFRKNMKQGYEHFDFLDRVGRNNAIGGGIMGAGWSEGVKQNISKWLSTQDSAFYNRNIMDHKELTQTLGAAESTGYFYKATDPKEFKRKVTDLVKNTRELMQTMKMANDEAAALLGEMDFNGFKTPMKTIKQMNSVAAATGLSFTEVKNFGIQYGTSMNSQYGIDKGVAASMGMTTLGRYDKKQQGAAMAEMSMIDRILSDRSMQVAATMVDPLTGRLMLDNNALNKMASLSPIERMNMAGYKASNMNGIQMAELNALAPQIMANMTGTQMSNILKNKYTNEIQYVLENVDPQGYQRAAKYGKVDSSEFIQGLNEQQRALATKMLQGKIGTDFKTASDVFERIASASAVDQRGAKTAGDIRLHDALVSNKWYSRAKYESDIATNTRREAEVSDTLWKPAHIRSLENSWLRVMDGSRDDARINLWASGRQSLYGAMQYASMENNKGYMDEMDALGMQMSKQKYGGAFAARSAHALMRALGVVEAGGIGLNAVDKASRATMYSFYSQNYDSVTAEKMVNQEMSGRDVMRMTLAAAEGNTEAIKEKNAYLRGIKDPNRMELKDGRGEIHRRMFMGVLNSRDMIQEIKNRYSEETDPGKLKNINNLMSTGLILDNQALLDANIYTSSGKLKESEARGMSAYTRQIASNVNKHLESILAKDSSGKTKRLLEATQNTSARHLVKDASKLAKYMEDSGEFSQEDVALVLGRVKATNKHGDVLAGTHVGNLIESQYMQRGKDTILNAMIGGDVGAAFQGSQAKRYLGMLADKDSNMYKSLSTQEGISRVAEEMKSAIIKEQEKTGVRLTAKRKEDIGLQVKEMLSAAAEKGGDSNVIQAMREMHKMSGGAAADMGGAIDLLNEGTKVMSGYLKDISSAVEGNTLKIVDVTKTRGGKTIHSNFGKSPYAEGDK